MKRVLSKFWALAFLAYLFLPITLVAAQPSITIVSPSEGQLIPGTSFTASGTATPNTTILLQSSGRTFAKTESDNSGNWSVESTLPAGEVSMTAKAISDTEYVYFTTSPDQTNTFINQLRTSDRTINPNPGWPIQTTNTTVFLTASGAQNIFYSSDAFNTSGVGVPNKFNADSPSDPVPVTGSYPLGIASLKGEFNESGSKYYSLNVNDSRVSVIDVASNAWQEDINLGSGFSALGLKRSPFNGKIYVGDHDSKVHVIDPATDTVEKTIDLPCPISSVVTGLIFASDPQYPYYFAPCFDDSSLVKLKVNDDSVVSVTQLPVAISGGVFDLDNSKIYGFANFNYPDSDKVQIINPDTVTVSSVVQLSGGALGLYGTADAKHIYVPTPGGSFSDQNIDQIDTETNAVTSIPTSGVAFDVTASPVETDTQTVSVSFVLGAQMAVSKGDLAKTGLVIMLATPIGLFLLAGALFTYYDYQKHKQPLLEAAENNVAYSYWHHLRVVSVPLMKYRLAIGVEEKLPEKSDKIRRI